MATATAATTAPVSAQQTKQPRLKQKYRSEIAANLTKLAERSRRHFRAHCGSDEDSVNPIEGLED